MMYAQANRQTRSPTFNNELYFGIYGLQSLILNLKAV
jgi:hypothetical protein